VGSIHRSRIALKGPCGTPVGAGFRSVNVALRKEFNLFANMRPARAFEHRVALPFDGPPTTDDGTTAYRLERLPDRVPLSRIDLEIDTPEFVRRVALEASTRRQAWFRIGGGVIYRVGPGTHRPARIDESVTLDLAREDRPFLRLVIQDGDNPPLGVRGVAGRYPAEEIVFRAATAGPHTLFVGRADDRAPRYDLADLLHRGAASPPRPAGLGPLRRNPLCGGEPASEPVPAWTERHKTLLMVLVGAVVLALALWTVRLLRRAGQTA